jgi:hypothetical protein
MLTTDHIFMGCYVAFIRAQAAEAAAEAKLLAVQRDANDELMKLRTRLHDAQQVRTRAQNPPSSGREQFSPQPLPVDACTRLGTTSH